MAYKSRLTESPGRQGLGGWVKLPVEGFTPADCLKMEG